MKRSQHSLAKNKFFGAGILCIFLLIDVQAQVNKYIPVKQVAAEFKALLQRPAVDFNPEFQSTPTDSVLIEKGFIYSQKNEKIPVLIYKPVSTKVTSFPAVICLHGTGGNKDQEDIRDLLYRFTRKGFMGVAIDARYHGERIAGGAHGSKEYAEAITRAWENKDPDRQERPFYFDTVYDLWRLTDYLSQRPDVQKTRIGMIGISMGGIETWMAASVDQRIKVTVPVIAAQSFRWSLENDQWQGRARTILAVHEQAAKDLGDSTVNKENVKAVWDKLVPGITGKFDCPSMIRLFVPRPLLLLNTEKDPNNPLPGAKIAFESAKRAYRSANASEKLQVDVAPNEPHRFISKHKEMAIAFFAKWL
jgi:dienelactone hydrolase